jgi:hypothetical protein
MYLMVTFLIDLLREKSPIVTENIISALMGSIEKQIIVELSRQD